MGPRKTSEQHILLGKKDMANGPVSMLSTVQQWHKKVTEGTAALPYHCNESQSMNWMELCMRVTSSNLFFLDSATKLSGYIVMLLPLWFA